MAAYQQLLGRDPNTAGLDYHVARLTSGGTRAREQFVYGLLFSPEGSRHEVRRAYLALLERNADAAGEDYWTNHLAGHGVLDLRVLLLASDEYHHGSGGADGAWLDAVYRDELGRGVDGTGAAYWSALLDAGLPRALVVAGIQQSDEALRGPGPHLLPRGPGPGAVVVRAGRSGRGAPDPRRPDPPGPAVGVGGGVRDPSPSGVAIMTGADLLADLGTLAAVVTAVVFAVAGVAKARSRTTTVGELSALGVPGAAVAATVLPAVELATAIAVLLRPSVGALVAVALLTVFTGFVAVAVARGATVSCGCFGSLSRSPLSWTTVGRNLGLVGIALTAATVDRLARPDLALTLVVVGTGLVVAVVAELARARDRLGRIWSVELAGEQRSPTGNEGRERSSGRNELVGDRTAVGRSAIGGGTT